MSLQYELETAQEKLRVYNESIELLKKSILGLSMSYSIENAKEFGRLMRDTIDLMELQIEAIDTDETEPAKVIANRFKGMDNYNDYLNEVKNTELS